MENIFTYNCGKKFTLIDDWFILNAGKINNSTIDILQISNILINNLPRFVINALSLLSTKEAQYTVVLIKNLFQNKDPKLAQIVHTSISSYLIGIKDIVYPYEEHSLLYPKRSGIEFSEWSHGLGPISPHSDDIYENIEVNVLSITISRDETNTKTKFYLIKDLIKILTKKELESLSSIEAVFISGKNVRDKVIKKTRKIREFYNGKERFNFDFRIDNIVGERMQTDIPEDKRILDKLRQNIDFCNYVISDGQTGTFVAIDNFSVLHARDALPPMEIKNKLEDSKRLLFRSKGQKLQLLDLGNF